MVLKIKERNLESVTDIVELVRKCVCGRVYRRVLDVENYT